MGFGRWIKDLLIPVWGIAVDLQLREAFKLGLSLTEQTEPWNPFLAVQPLPMAITISQG